MRRPEVIEVRDYCKKTLWEEVFSAKHGPRINLKIAITQHLVSSGVIPILAEEFAEKQLSLACGDLSETKEEWINLGIPPPLWIADQAGLLVTWKHPKFNEIADTEGLSPHFPYFWNAIRNTNPVELLFYMAGYLHVIGCDNIYITDKSGDGGIDLIGVKTQGHFKGLCFVVQSKFAGASVGKDSFLCDYSKSILSERTGRWKLYTQEIGLSKNQDGFSKAHIFATNNEFKDSIRDAAKELGITLRSGRQIAHCLSAYFTPAQFESIRTRVPTIEGSTKLDYKNIFTGSA